MFPIKKEKNLEDFLINRFGKELYETFFKDYTEKVWGVPCNQISAEWGAQRIKGISISKAIRHSLSTSVHKAKDLEQKETETSFISRFMYPKLGPGQMWETVAQIIEEKGGIIIRNSTVVKMETKDSKIISLSYTVAGNMEPVIIKGEHFLSTMPVKDLIRAMGNNVPSEVKSVSEGLQYRDFITVGLLVDELKISNKEKSSQKKINDNWIYIQEKNVKLGRLQIYNNWSPYMVADPKKIWLGLEYFCNEGDLLWKMEEKDFIQFAISELASIGIIDSKSVSDSKYIRMPKTYPAYFGTYSNFHKIRKFTDGFSNLFLIGRNGMHKYNNQDHSMLTAMAAVENIISKETSKENIWNINTHEEYHEETD
jgi:protoporphyrinogen oxidase